MLNIGRKQKLVVVKKVEFGIYLGETREAGEKEQKREMSWKYFCTAIPATV